MVNRWALVVLVSLALIPGCTQTAGAPLDTLVDIGTHKLHILCTGTGQPTIVIDTGVGETYESWEPIIESLSQDVRVCAYDRAGYGQSESGPLPRNSQRAADELSLLLANAGESGPFLLLGHSLGALNVQVYADSNPEDVVGLVLLDPTPLDWITGQDFPELRELFLQETSALREAADEANASTDRDGATNADFLQSVASEHEQLFKQTGERVAAIASFGDIPLIVIGATEPEPQFGEHAEAFRRYWNEQSQALASTSESAEFILAEGSSHHIHLDAPELVIEIILEMTQ